MVKKKLIMLPIILFLFIGLAGCSTFSDEPDEEFMDEDAGSGASAQELADLQRKVNELASTVAEAENKVTLLGDDVDDIQAKIRNEKDSLEELQKTLNEYKSPGSNSSKKDIEELEKQIRVLENDIKWMKRR